MPPSTPSQIDVLFFIIVAAYICTNIQIQSVESICHVACLYVTSGLAGQFVLDNQLRVSALGEANSPMCPVNNWHVVFCLSWDPVRFPTSA